jgi:Mrp family chromosome partitioning ATPase
MVLIDSPPPQMTSETSAMARQVDGILLVVRFLKSNKEMTSELVAMLDRERILGVVGNHLDIKTLSYYGKSKYTNYGHYYGR